MRKILILFLASVYSLSVLSEDRVCSSKNKPNYKVHPYISNFCTLKGDDAPAKPDEIIGTSDYGNIILWLNTNFILNFLNNHSDFDTANIKKMDVNFTLGEKD